jgi:hypothetical protein
MDSTRDQKDGPAGPSRERGKVDMRRKHMDRLDGCFVPSTFASLVLLDAHMASAFARLFWMRLAQTKSD